MTRRDNVKYPIYPNGHSAPSQSPWLDILRPCFSNTRSSRRPIPRPQSSNVKTALVHPHHRPKCSTTTTTIAATNHHNLHSSSNIHHWPSREKTFRPTAPSSSTAPLDPDSWSLSRRVRTRSARRANNIPRPRPACHLPHPQSISPRILPSLTAIQISASSNASMLHQSPGVLYHLHHR